MKLKNILSLFIVIGFYLSYIIKPTPKADINKALKNNNMTIKPRKSYTKYIGIPYFWGGNTLKKTDCSGLVKMYYNNELNFKLPRTAQLMSYLGHKISKDSLKPNDLLFFGNRHITHVALYIGNNKILQATSHGSKIDSIGSAVWNNYWKYRYVFSKRIL